MPRAHRRAGRHPAATVYRGARRERRAAARPRQGRGRLWRDPGRQGHRPHRRAGRARLPDRRQRRRQDHDAERHLRPAAGKERDHPLRGRGHHRQGGFPARAAGPRDGARRTRRVRRADHRGEPVDGRLRAARPRRDPGRRRARLRAFSAPEGAPQADGGHDVGRRAADAGDGAGADVAPEAAPARRAVDGVGTADGAEGVRDGAHRFGRRRHHPPHRAEREARPRGEPPRLRDGVEIILQGDAKKLLHDPAVRAAYLGEGAG